MQALSQSIWISADALIEKMKQSGDSDYDLVREHLETAHAYSLGAMPAECTHNLELAQPASEALSGKPVEHELQTSIATLLFEVHRSAPAHWRHVPRSTEIGLAEFFQRAGVSFGMFYPKQ